jgi:peptide-methionine (S)-S-oxide reductase
MFGLSHKTKMVDAADALPGRDVELPVAERHAVLGTPLKPPFPEGFQQAVVGMGCFWGAERVFWQAPGVYTTAVGYAGGYTPNPTYEEVCSGRTGHNEVVLIVFDPAKTSYEDILRLFWENHDPTQGMRQGNDVGTQYRSAIYTFDEGQRAAAEASRATYAERLRAAGYPDVTTEIEPSCLRPARHPASLDRAGHESSCSPFYYAEDYHQQYLHKNPWGYCGLGGTGVSCPIGVGVAQEA